MLICSASFGLSMNLVEAVWKAKIKELYPSVTEFAAFSSIYILWTGVIIMILTIVGTNIMRTRSWFYCCSYYTNCYSNYWDSVFCIGCFDKAIFFFL